MRKKKVLSTTDDVTCPRIPALLSISFRHSTTVFGRVAWPHGVRSSIHSRRSQSSFAGVVMAMDGFISGACLGGNSIFDLWQCGAKNFAIPACTKRSTTIRTTLCPLGAFTTLMNVPKMESNNGNIRPRRYPIPSRSSPLMERFSLRLTF